MTTAPIEQRSTTLRRAAVPAALAMLLGAIVGVTALDPSADGAAPGHGQAAPTSATTQVSHHLGVAWCLVSGKGSGAGCLHRLQ